MPVAHIVNEVAIERTPRVLQLEGLFEIAPTQRSAETWDVQLPIEEEDWNVGLIVGPSGSGKSTLARHLFPELRGEYAWPADKAIVDGFPAKMGIKEVTALLSSVGFSSPPSWLRPFRVLSNGEQFRATMARGLAENPELLVIDEFTSVVDRQVAKIAASAIAKAVRRRKQRFIGVSCHYDIIDWLAPDWVLEMPAGTFTRRSLRRRPDIALTIRRVHANAWDLFKRYHYLSSNLHRAAKCFVAFQAQCPCAFASVIHFTHPQKSSWREHRTVCLPDFQGAGIGNALSEFVAALFRATGKPYTSVTGNPSMIWHRARSPLWKMTRKPGRQNNQHRGLGGRKSAATDRFTAGFQYVGPIRREEAKAFGVIR